MKILTVVHQFLPRHRAGTEIHTAQLAAAMRARGHEVEVLTCEHTGDRPQYEVGRRDFEGIPVHEVAFGHQVRDFEETYANPAMNRAVSAVTERVRPDLVHFQHSMFFGADAIRAAADCGVPVVATLHEYWLLCHRGTFLLENLEVCEKGPRPDLCAECGSRAPLVPEKYARKERALAMPLAMDRRARTMAERARLVELFLSPSRFLRDRFLQAGFVEPQRIVVVEHGLPPIAAAARVHTRHRAGTPLRIGYIGTIADYKGIEVLARATDSLADLSCEFEIHGALDWFPAFVERAKAATRNPRVQWRGGFEPARAPEILASLDLIVVPSLWFENAPVTILEAHRAGVPVVASDFGAMREALARGGGVTFRRNDADDLAAKLRQFVSDENAYRELCLSIPRVRTDAEMAAETESYFERVVAAFRARGGRDRIAAGVAGGFANGHVARVPAEAKKGKRVLFVNPFTLPESVGGVQMHLGLVARELRARGHDVAIFRSDAADPTTPEFSVRTTEHEGVRLHGVTYRWSDFGDGFHRLLTDPSIDRAFAEVLEREKPDVVHAHGLTCLSSTILDVAKQRGARVGLTLHDFWMGCPRGQRMTRELELCRTIDRRRCVPCLGGMWPAFFPDEKTGLAALEDYDRRIRRALTVPDFLVTPSEHHRLAYVREWNLDERRVHAVPPGLDPAPFRDLRRVASPRFRVGFIGSVIPSKGVHTLIDAVNRLPNEACVLRIHGEAYAWHEKTDYLDDLKKRVKRGHPVEFGGRYRNEELPQLLANLDVLVVPSLWFESYCMTIREGFLANVPVIASRLGPMADAIEDYVTGLLFEPGNVEDLERCLRRVLDDARLRNDLMRAPKAVPTAADVTDALLRLYETP